MKGSCLCGGVEFELVEVTGPLELCHCARCRKVSGSASLAWLGALTVGYRVIRGAELFARFEAPVVEQPPGYTVHFCSRCGSPLPDPEPEGDWFEIPPGLMDDGRLPSPERHVYVDFSASWDEINRSLPEYTGEQIRHHRRKFGRVPG